ncbi:acyl-CoA dehydrogenase family protein [Alicyclobacillaceae bacterium I2511]|nr:acyl-CoA dehydrogenase family protein [Alicyclobacillaceae bacterium I2511]
MQHLYLTAEHEMFRHTLRRFLEREAVPKFDGWERDRLIPKGFWRKMGNQGYLCPMVSEEYGGAGGDFGHSVVVNVEKDVPN